MSRNTGDGLLITLGFPTRGRSRAAGSEGSWQAQHRILERSGRDDTFMPAWRTHFKRLT